MVLVSLALGVAIFVSSYESVVAAQVAITASANEMSSKAEWEVSQGRYLGISESVLDKLRAIPGSVATPIIEATVSTTGTHPESLLVIGLDLDSDANSKLLGVTSDVDFTPFIKLRLAGSGVVLSKTFADKHRLTEGSEVAFRSGDSQKQVPVVGFVTGKKLALIGGGNFGFMDIHEVERDFGKPGLVDKIEVAGISKTQIEHACPSCQIERPGKLGSAAEDALGRIKSLLGVSVIALLVGILLIYNAVQVSVLERLQDIAILRSIGATRIQIFTMLLAEWFVIGMVGSAAGIGVGSGLAIALVEYTKRTVNTMVPLVADAHVQVGLPLIIAAMIVGTGTALVAAFSPIWTAANVRPLEILRPYSYRRTHRYGPAAVAGLVLFVLANVVVATQSVSFPIGIGITGVEFFGMALMFPQVVFVVGSRMRILLRRFRNPAPYLALDGLLKTPHRTAFTMMTFGCALMMIVATETLVSGFRASTGMWMNSAFPFDLSVMGNDLASNVYGNQVLPTPMVDRMRGLPGVMSAYSVRKLFTPYKGQDVMAIALEMDRYLNARQQKGMGVWPPELHDPAVLAEFKTGKAAFVSSNFAQLYGVHSGDVLTVDTPSGKLALNVLGLVDDYSWQHGAFILDLATLEHWWKDDGVSYIDVSVAPGHALAEVKEKVEAAASTDRAAFTYDKAEIRDVTNSVLEQAVAMANLQASIGILIGVLGIVNSIWIGVMNRKREIALWRSIGVTKRQVGQIILFEGLFVALVAAFVGSIGGLYGGWVPLRAFSFEVTGFLYPLVVPWSEIGFELILALTLGLVAGALPARQATKLPILDSIGYE